MNPTERQVFHMKTHTQRIASPGTILLIVALVLALAIPVLPAQADAYIPAGTTATVAVGSAAVYATAALGSPVITQLSAGTRVQVISYGANWTQIMLGGGVSGYVVTGYLSFGAPVPTTPPVSTTATVASGPLNVHSGPSLAASVIARLSAGTRVQVISFDINWAHIKLSGNRTGYVDTSYLTFGSPAPGPATPGHEKAKTPGANASVRTQNRGPINLRSQPSLDAPVINAYANGSRVQALSKKAGWYYVRVDSVKGYIDMQYIVLDNGVTLEGDGSYDGVVQNATAGQILHLRQRPDTKSRSLGEYHNGTYVEILDMGTEWLHVSVAGKDGYMMAKYVHVVSPGLTAERTVLSTSGGDVPVYEKASDKGEPVARLSNGATVTVVIPGAGWSQVQVTVDGKTMTGYIQDGLLHAVDTPVPEYTEFMISG